MQSSVSFVLDGRLTRVEFSPSSRLRPTTTVLQYLRGLTNHKGVKEGCAEGDCGACTVVVAKPTRSDRLSYQAIDSCLLFLPMLHGKQLITIENLKAPDGTLHPVQQAMVQMYGSQCGFCTPGIVMSLFALTKSPVKSRREDIIDALAGNLCRCTGYRPIIEAAESVLEGNAGDHFASEESEVVNLLKSIPRESVLIDDGIQAFFRPATLEEALDYIHQRADTTVVCGATDVALRVTKEHQRIPNILDVSDLEELCTIGRSPDGISIGAAAPLSLVAEKIQPDYHALSRMLSVFGSRQIRNVATLGGNLGTASPIADTLPVLVAHDAQVVLQSRTYERTLRAEDFILGYRKTARKTDELIVAVRIPRVAPGVIIRSYKVSKRKDVDISTVSGGFRLELDQERRVESIILAYGGMADHTARALNAEEFLLGKPWQREWVEQALPLIDRAFTPISDARSGSTFRRVAARNLLMKFWSETSSDHQGEMPLSTEEARVQ